ncbi:pyridoxal phosphate-dependent aminotransferase [Granulicella cerasi]|uniref:Aminotransferase n=1 Tax=Granulicella cerasi TaxID=741063 RepID=A0ABW1Z517_9BACT|nr:pyridoxal phosphate-dependent aminotransferase [Granulicella cerasi]
MSSATASRKVLTDRINRIEVSATMAITAEALKLKAQGIDLADFGAGEPHFSTPQHIKDAAIEAINSNFTRYTAVAGIPQVRQAIVDRHASDFKTNYTPEECVFSAGGKLAIFNAAEVLIDHGDEVIIPTPFWVSYKDIVEFVGGKCVFVETSEADNFRVTKEMIEAAITPKTKAIILNFPSNPSGAILPKEDLFDIIRLCHERGIYALLDECYVYLAFDGDIYSGASLTECKEHIIVLGSLSKTYAMTGWRAGFALGPKQIIGAMSKLQSQSTSNTSSIVQRASIAALASSQECVAVMREDYIKLRDRVLEGFKTIPGLTCTVPQGAFYVYPNIKNFLGKGGINTASEMAAKLLSEAHIVTVPGEPFGTKEHIRLSYAVSADVIDKGIERLRTFLGNLK